MVSDGLHLRFLTGSQDLYGEETLARVAEQARAVVAGLVASGTVPVRIEGPLVVKSPDGIRRACLDAEGQAIADVLADLGAPPCLPPSVKYADLVLRATERRDLHPPHDDAWTGTTQASSLAPPIQPLAPIVAKHLFLDRYYELQPQADRRRDQNEEGAT